MTEQPPDRVPADDRFEWERKLRTAALTPRGKAVALTMATYGNADGTRIFPSITQLSEDTGLSTRTVDRALKELREAGFIEQLKRGRAMGRGLEGFSSSYRLTFPLAVLPTENNTTPMAHCFEDEADSETCGKLTAESKNNPPSVQNNPPSVQNNTTKTTELHDTHGVLPSHIPNHLRPHQNHQSPEAHQRDETSEKSVDNFSGKKLTDPSPYLAANAYLQRFPDEHPALMARARSENPGTTSPTELVILAATLKGWKHDEAAA